MRLQHHRTRNHAEWWSQLLPHKILICKSCCWFSTLKPHAVKSNSLLLQPHGHQKQHPNKMLRYNRTRACTSPSWIYPTTQHLFQPRWFHLGSRLCGGPMPLKNRQQAVTPVFCSKDWWNRFPWRVDDQCFHDTDYFKWLFACSTLRRSNPLHFLLLACCCWWRQQLLLLVFILLLLLLLYIQAPWSHSKNFSPAIVIPLLAMINR